MTKPLTEDPAWITETRRHMGPPPAQPREWRVEVMLPDGRDPLLLVPDPVALGSALAPEGWRAHYGSTFSGRGCTMAPTWRNWRLELRYLPAGSALPAAPWALTPDAICAYAAARRWDDSTHSYERAERELIEIMPHATFRANDALGRELYRSPRRHGSLRWIIARGRVVWVGMSAPPRHVWAPEP